MGWAGHIRGGYPGRRFGRFRGVGVVFAIFGVVHVRVRVCWLSTERWWVPMTFGGASRPFSFLNVRWCEGMVGDGEGDEEIGRAHV